MHAVRTYGPGDLRVEAVPEPQLVEPTDALVKVTASAICGSDLHLYHGKIPGIEAGMVCGHEFAGEVVEVGAGVLDIVAGQRCVASMFSACGRCPACLRMEHRRCPRFGMFGYGVAFGDLAGGQAEYVRVPFADMTLAAIPEGLSDHDVLLTSDILPTAYTALERGGAGSGDVVAVVGAGPLGQLVTMCAPLFGCSTVIAIDVVPDRLKEAEALGAVPVDARSEDPFDAVYDVTGNQGADLVIEAAGNGAALEPWPSSGSPAGSSWSACSSTSRSRSRPARRSCGACRSPAWSASRSGTAPISSASSAPAGSTRPGSSPTRCR